MWLSNWPVVERFLAAVGFWITGPHGHLQRVDYSNLRACWDAEGTVVTQDTWRALGPMFAEMKRVTNAWVSAKIESAQNA